MHEGTSDLKLLLQAHAAEHPIEQEEALIHELAEGGRVVLHPTGEFSQLPSAVDPALPMQSASSDPSCHAGAVGCQPGLQPFIYVPAERI